MDKLYRRATQFIIKEGLKSCKNRELAIYAIEYEFCLSFHTAERIFDSVEG